MTRARTAALALAGLACAPFGTTGNGPFGTSVGETTTSSDAPTESTASASVGTSEGSTATSGPATTTTTSATTSATTEGSSGSAEVDSSGGSESGGARGCAGFDPNGVAQIYCTDETKAAPWTLGFDDWESRTRSFGDVSGDGALTELEQAGQTRMTVMAVEDDCEGLTDHGEALAQGWMCTADDWRNFEITGYFQLVEAADASTDQDWTLYGNGGRHTGDGPPTGCMGSSYKASYHYVDGEVRFAKESWHVNYDHTDWQAVDGGLDYSAATDAWLGMKMARYEFERDGEVGVRVELWLDLGGIDGDGAPSNDWQLANVREDHPGSPWGSNAGDCNAPQDDQIMLWGGPWVTWRWDETTSRLRLMSAREIIPPEDVPAP